METNAFNIKKGWASNLFCFLTLFAVLNIFFLINVDLLFDLQNSVFLNLAIVLGGLHAMVTRGVGWEHAPLYGQYGDVPLDRPLSENRI